MGMAENEHINNQSTVSYSTVAPPSSSSSPSPDKTTKKKKSNSKSKSKSSDESTLPSVISERKIRAVTYDTHNHVAVLSQMHGSIWPKVIPYCLCNVVLTLSVLYLRRYRNVDLTFSDKGHTFMSMMVSFLVVTRSNIAYSRFMESRDNLNVAMKACRELVQHAITFTRYDSSPRAKQWRSELARRTVVLLRTVVSVLEYQTKGQHAWKIPELSKDEKKALLLSVGKSNERSPMVLTMFMRSTISSQVEFLEKPMHCNKELRLFSFVSEFVTAYHGLMKLVTTPFPFPLVQMARTFLFVWIFTLPFALVNDILDTPALVMLIFFITYGFIGLEAVSIELDDPFGDDPNDFDVLGLAEVVFEDIFIAIYDIDGKEAANALRGNYLPSHEVNKRSTKEEGSLMYSMSGSAEKRANRHKRYCSIDAWNNAVPSPAVKVGTDRSLLLEGTNLAGTKERGSQRTIDVFGQGGPGPSFDNNSVNSGGVGSMAGGGVGSMVGGVPSMNVIGGGEMGGNTMGIRPPTPQSMIGGNNLDLGSIFEGTTLTSPPPPQMGTISALESPPPVPVFRAEGLTYPAPSSHPRPTHIRSRSRSSGMVPGIPSSASPVSPSQGGIPRPLPRPRPRAGSSDRHIVGRTRARTGSSDMAPLSLGRSTSENQKDSKPPRDKRSPGERGVSFRV